MLHELIDAAMAVAYQCAGQDGEDVLPAVEEDEYSALAISRDLAIVPVAAGGSVDETAGFVPDATAAAAEGTAREEATDERLTDELVDAVFA
ncbi:MAG: hypothetical protein CMJ58_17385 [Planctomycetaceae bacterium]|nr:hypothetical protein [Planctomycetaceae bacterium]